MRQPRSSAGNSPSSAADRHSHYIAHGRPDRKTDRNTHADRRSDRNLNFKSRTDGDADDCPKPDHPKAHCQCSTSLRRPRR